MVDISLAAETAINAVPVSAQEIPAPTVTQNTLSTGGRLTDIDKGGISKTISANTSAVTDRSQKIGTLNINTQQPLTPGQLAEWQELHA